jgi:hypothetical protein
MEMQKIEDSDPPRIPWELPSLSGIVFGSILFVTGMSLIMTVIGAPFGLLLFALGLGWMLTPKDRAKR